MRRTVQWAVGWTADADGFEVAWVDRALHEEAVQQLGRSPRVSLVDRVSFHVMRQRKVEKAFAFERGKQGLPSQAVRGKLHFARPNSAETMLN